MSPIKSKTDRLALRKGVSAVYHLYIGNELKYIGQTKNLRSRLQRHVVPYTHFSYLEVPSDYLLAVEGMHIARLVPDLNGKAHAGSIRMVFYPSSKELNQIEKLYKAQCLRSPSQWMSCLVRVALRQNRLSK